MSPPLRSCSILSAPLLPVAILVLLLTGWSPRAEARHGARRSHVTEEQRQLARERFEAGASLYQEGQLERAHQAFREAYDLSGEPDLLFNLATVSERLGRKAEAIQYLASYLRLRPHAPDRKQVLLRIEQLGREAEQPPPAFQPPPPGSPVQPPQPPARALHPPWPALALGAGGVLLIGAAAGLGGGALATAKEVNSGEFFDAQADQRGRALQAGAIALGVIGGVAVGTGLAWIGWWALGSRRGTRTALRPNGLGVALAGSF